MMAAAHWSAALVGLPWRERGRGQDGVDCWGLIVLAFAGRGIALSSYAEHYAGVGERARVAALLAEHAGAAPWRPIDGPERPWDVLLFRAGGVATHVGIVTEPGAMLHIRPGHDSAIERWWGPVWEPRHLGTYRHRALDDAADGTAS